MLLRRWGGLAVLTLLAAVPQAFAPPAEAGLPRIFRKKEEPKPPVVLLAEKIDEVEESLNEDGTIVVKKPDIWGESRLTKHREQVEDELEKKLSSFQLLLNGSINRSDAAYFANAFAIQATLNPAATSVPTFGAGGYVTKSVGGSEVVIQNPANLLGVTTVETTKEGKTTTTTTPVVDPADLNPSITINSDPAKAGFAVTGISLEPTIQLDQLKRYLDHLNELRRLNEGGDTSDAPGYSLNLVRMPVSVLPGGETRIGHGAEVTVTAEMHLTEELLPSQFRTLVVQDLVDELSLPLVKLYDVVVQIERNKAEAAKAERELAQAVVDEATAAAKAATAEGLAFEARSNAAGLAKWYQAIRDAKTRLDIGTAIIEISEITVLYPKATYDQVILDRLDAALKECKPADTTIRCKFLAFARRMFSDELRSLARSDRIARKKVALAEVNNSIDKIVLLEATRNAGGSLMATVTGTAGDVAKAAAAKAFRSAVLEAAPDDIVLPAEIGLAAAEASESNVTAALSEAIEQAQRDVATASTAEEVDAAVRRLIEVASNTAAKKTQGTLASEEDAPNLVAPLAEIKGLGAPAIENLGPEVRKGLARQAEAVRAEVLRTTEQKLNASYQSSVAESKKVQEALALAEAKAPLFGVSAPASSPSGDGGDDDPVVSEVKTLAEGLLPSLTETAESELKARNDELARRQAAQRSLQTDTERLRAELSDLQSRVRQSASAVRAGSPTRRARLPVAPTQIACVFGSQELMALAEKFGQAADRDCGELRLSQARAFLKEELEAAYDYLNTPSACEAWAHVPMIAQAVRAGDGNTLCSLRAEVVKDLFCECSDGTCPPSPQRSTLTLLGWAILVEAGLLDQRLNEDVKRVSQDPDCGCSCDGPHAFYLPDPPIEARHAFMEYVRCRWPIHVFALDPVTQDQNLQDVFAMRRELKLAAALALAGGYASASDTMQFVRRIEMEQETIELNRTAVAFAHGANNFGWRFYPRFQTAEIESNGTVLFRDLLAGGPRRDHLIRDYRLEPGMRECVALVVMPSFVPHVRFDIRSNWFELTDPEDTEASVVETVELSRKIRDMQRLMEVCTIEADNYRPGEVQRLQARVKQLSDKLPLQTVHAQVPYENTTGGFELFSSGVTDLSPELIDFYGAPGVDPAIDTFLFLVGNNFSVHQTEVVAGNKLCESALLSRDVMRVKIPAGTKPIVCRRQAVPGDDPCVKCRPGLPCSADCYEAVELHLATPYGVSGRLLIPVVPNPAAVAAAAAATAAATAVSRHEAQFHPVSFDWASPKVGGWVCYDQATRLLDRFCLQGTPIVTAKNLGSPFGAAPDLEFAANILAEIDGKEVRLGSTLAIPLPFTKGLNGWSFKEERCATGATAADASPTFSQEVRSVLRGSDIAYGLKAIRIRGYVRFPGGSHEGVRITNDLVIALEGYEFNSCSPTSACPECTTGTTAVGPSAAADGRLTVNPVSFRSQVDEQAEEALTERVVAPEPGPAIPLQENPSEFLDGPPAPAVPSGAIPTDEEPSRSTTSQPPVIVAPLAGGLAPPTIVIQNEQATPAPPADPPRRHRGVLHRLFRQRF